MLENRTVLLGSSSGLCNRIRMLSNWLGRVQRIRMLWPITTECPAFWTELFKPLERVHFDYASRKQADRHRKPITALRVLTLDNLTPIFDVPKIQNSYIAVHVRRTDLIRLKQKNSVEIESDEYYFNQIDESGLDLIYLASDSAKTQNAFKRQYKDRLLFFEDITTYGSKIRPVRCSSMYHAVADLYTCADATKFIPTRFSSFSGFINGTRQSRINKMGCSINNSTS